MNMLVHRFLAPVHGALIARNGVGSYCAATPLRAKVFGLRMRACRLDISHRRWNLPGAGPHDRHAVANPITLAFARMPRHCSPS